tara:strand:+ start:84 stop:1583 length:1500 start_codon:yes stop_codon:yes gene_type:complete
MNEEEELNLDDVFDVPRAQYEINRQKLNESRVVDPNRFQEQLDTIQTVVNPEDPTFLSELLMDMKTGFDTAKKVPGGPVPKVVAAGGAIATRRALKGILDNVFDNVDPYGFFKKNAITVEAMTKKPRPGNFSTTGAFGRARFYYSPDHTEKIARELVNTWGMRNGIFNYDQYEIMRPKVVPSKSRLFGELFETPAFQKVDFNKMQQALVQGESGLRNKYRNIIEKLGFPPTKFQLHHTVPIKGSLPGYDGLAFGSDEWWEVTEILFRNMLRPGNDAFNLIPLVGGNKPTTLFREGVPYRFPTPHSVSHKFLDDKIGPSGELFWTKEVRTKMKKDFDFRRQKWQEYSEIVKKSQDVTNQAELIFRDLYENIPEDQLSDELDLVIERLVKLDNTGKLDTTIVNGNYQVPQMQDIVADITKQMRESELDAMLDTVTGRMQKQREFVDRRILEDQELRLLDTMSMADQMTVLRNMTGMTVEDIDLLIKTRPNFDVVKFIRDNQ